MATDCPLAWAKDALGFYWLIDGEGRELATVCPDTNAGGVRRYLVSLAAAPDTVVYAADSLAQAKSFAEHETRTEAR